MWYVGFGGKFLGHLFGHAFFKACQYATIKEFFCKDLWNVSIKSTQVDLLKCIT
jgi:hypothetical protein